MVLFLYSHILTSGLYHSVGRKRQTQVKGVGGRERKNKNAVTPTAKFIYTTEIKECRVWERVHLEMSVKEDSDNRIAPYTGA